MMKIARLHPMLAKNAKAFRQLVVLANDRPGVPGRAEILGRIEAERTDRAHCAGLPRAAVFRRILGADRLRGVLDHAEEKRAAISLIASISQHKPKRCTGTIALTNRPAVSTNSPCSFRWQRFSRKSAMAPSEMLKVTGSMS